jgi:uncharacterized protein
MNSYFITRLFQVVVFLEIDGSPDNVQDANMRDLGTLGPDVVVSWRIMDISEKITDELKSIERENNVRILLAVESGSRAWGFPSADSDYDVRFIYAHHPSWYLSIDLEDRRDVIERPLKDMLDISGWDIRKALKLFRKSNPPLIEWLQCPIIYLENHYFSARLRSLLPDFYSPRASFFHYLHMARGNFREYLQGESVRRKKYFYVLRPLLAIRWIEQGQGPVPIEFARLVTATIDDARLRSAIDELVDAKSKGEELDYGPPIPIISDFVSCEMSRLQTIAVEMGSEPAMAIDLNDFFRETLDQAWDGWKLT